MTKKKLCALDARPRAIQQAHIKPKSARRERERESEGEREGRRIRTKGQRLPPPRLQSDFFGGKEGEGTLFSHQPFAPFSSLCVNFFSFFTIIPHTPYIGRDEWK